MGSSAVAVVHKFAAASKLSKQTNAKYATSKIETKTLKYNKAPYPCPFRIPEVT
jgi:hypothetical protein